MEHSLYLKEEYLWIPIAREQPKVLCELFSEGEKKLELQVPLSVEDSEYPVDFYAPVYAGALKNKEILLKGDFTQAFASAVKQGAVWPGAPLKKEGAKRPDIHFSAITGWINDPNGLVYENGVYHLYFQYNPFDTQWDNMSWGHAVSRDLLHWEQLDTVLYPDEDGMMFSGCGLTNEEGLLALPKEALLFFYSAAGSSNPWSRGKEFVQKLAYSTDHGKTLIKSQDWIMPTVCKENRDPKIFRHKESGQYVMVLWLEKNDFGIFTSPDLREFVLTQRLTLEEAWECPDLLRLPIEGTKEEMWIFWSADGFYYLGEFDGRSFQTDGVQRKAYRDSLPYAAQTYAGVANRVISVPWLRTQNKDKCYRGIMGLPRELSLKQTKEGLVLAQSIVREWEQQRRLCFSQKDTKKVKVLQKPQGPVEICCSVTPGSRLEIELWGLMLVWDGKTAELCLGEETRKDFYLQQSLSVLADGEIIEITGDSGIMVTMFERAEAGKGDYIGIQCDVPADVYIYEG